MKVSAIMPTYRQTEFIEEAIRSLIDQVDELVIVIDGDDVTWDHLLTLDLADHVQVVQRPRNFGTAVAINVGFRETTGDLLTWVSSDNVYEPDWRETLEKVGAGAVYSAYWRGMDKTNVQFTEHEPGKLISQEACYYGPSFLLRRDVWEKAGPHRGKISHDYDHWLRVEEACWDLGYGIVGVEKPLCSYRVHPERAGVRLKDQYDAPRWQRIGRERRKSC